MVSGGTKRKSLIPKKFLNKYRTTMYTNEESPKRKAEIGKIESFKVPNLFFIDKIILICTAHAGPAG
jgi:hypothetical protein